MRFLILCCSAALIAACSSETPDTAKPEEAVAVAPSAAVSEALPDNVVENRGTEAGSGQWWDALPRPDWSNYEQVKTYYSWFEVYEIQDDIYAIYEPGQFEEVISWLIVGRNQALLFDTGLGMGDIRGVVKQITRNEVIVLNSHSHYDHIGGNHQFDLIMARNLPFTKERAKGIRHEEVAEFASKEWIWKPHPPNFDANDYQIKPYGFTHWIEENQFIDLGGISLEIVYAPGHAPDGIVLIEHNRRLMFTGDTFYPAPLYAHLDGSDFDAYAETASKLAALADKVDYLLPSHNVPLADASFLGKLDAAFQAIINDTAAFERSDSGREYQFEGFSILTNDPPVDAADMELL